MLKRKTAKFVVIAIIALLVIGALSSESTTNELLFTVETYGDNPRWIEYQREIFDSRRDCIVSIGGWDQENDRRRIIVVCRDNCTIGCAEVFSGLAR